MTLAVAMLCIGCAGPSPEPARHNTAPVVPQPTSAPARAADPDLPAPDQSATPAIDRKPVGPWLQYRVAASDLIEGKGFLKLHITPGYDSVLELTSYDAPDHEEFPSLYIRAILAPQKLTDLVNKKLPAQLYIQVEPDGNLIHNLPAQTVELVVTAIDDKYVRGTFRGPVHDVDLGGDGPITGKFQATVP